MSKEKDVGMGEYAIGEGSEVLSALGLGSCVAVCLYTEHSEKGGLAHVMLPEEKDGDSKKHADVLISDLLEVMEKNGVKTSLLKAKIFGGASMFEETTLDIGVQNVESVKNILKENNVDLEAEETGGNTGRAVWLNCRSGTVVVRKSGEQTKRY